MVLLILVLSLVLTVPRPKAGTVQPGSADLCFLVQDSVDEVLERLKNKGQDVLEGGKVVDRTGARGKLRSVYIRDPDDNLVECATPSRTASIWTLTYLDSQTW